MKKGDYAIVLFGVALLFIGILIILALVSPGAIEALVANIAKTLAVLVGLFIAGLGIYLVFAVIFKRKFWEED